jgi:hypothetical protein
MLIIIRKKVLAMSAKYPQKLQNSDREGGAGDCRKIKPTAAKSARAAELPGSIFGRQSNQVATRRQT